MVVLAVAAVAVLRLGSEEVGGKPDAAGRLRMEASDHHDGTRFVNAEPTTVIADGAYFEVLWNRFARSKGRRPSTPLPSVRPDPAQIESTQDPYAIWLGHGTVLVRIAGVTVLTDPVFDRRVKVVVGSTERFAPSPLAREDLPRIDAVLISHDHYDHLEMSTVIFLANRGTKFFVPLGIGAHLAAWGVPDSQIVELDWWESGSLGPLDLVCTPARHYSGRSPLRTGTTLWSSWALLGPGHRLFYGGDSGLSDQFAEIGARFGPFDMAMLPIGAYAETWPDIHMTPEDAVGVQKMLNAHRLLPVHWGTFDLAYHPWNEPAERLVRAAAETGAACVIPLPGAIVPLTDSLPPIDPWWRSGM